MARGAGIEDFPEKLRLALGRGNLSRAETARLVGVDKSVIARWLGGAVRPGDHSLSRLNAALAKHIEGFSGADWEGGLAQFRARLGLPGEAAKPADGVFSPFDLAIEISAETLDLAEQSHAGIWLLLYISVTGADRLMGYAARIHRPPGAPCLMLEFTNGAAGHGRGQAFVLLGRLYAFMAASRRRDSLGFFLLNTHVDERMAMLDGIICLRDGGLGAAPAAARALLIRIEDATDDTSLARCVPLANAATERRWETLLPASALAVFRDAPSNAARPQLLRVPADASWALRETELLDPHHAEKRALVRQVRAVFAG